MQSQITNKRSFKTTSWNVQFFGNHDGVMERVVGLV